MSSGQTAWNVLSDRINQRVQEARDKHNAAEAEERQNEFSLIMEGVRAHAANGTLTDDMLQQAQEKMQKLVPKDSHPLIDAFTKVAGHIRDARKKKGQGQGQGGQEQGQGGQNGDQGQPAAQPKPSSGPGPQAPSQPSGDAPAIKPTQTPAQPPAAPPSPGNRPPVPNVMIPPTPAQQGTAASQYTVAQEEGNRKYRQKIVADYRKSLGSKPVDPRMSEAMDMWAMGAPVTSASMGSTSGRTSEWHPVIVKGDKGVRIPAMQRRVPPFDVFGPDNEEIKNPEILSAAMKPKVGWGRDAKGYYSFNIDPETNQPMNGTLSRAGLPPSGLMPTSTLDAYHWVDDSGGVHEHRYTKTGGKKVPLTEWLGGEGEGEGTPTQAPAAVPPQMKGPAKKGTGAGTGAGTGKDTSTIGTKDTGILTGPAQTVIMKTQPVLDQVEGLLGDIDRLKLGSNNTPGYLFTARVKYGVGMASPEGTLASDIAGLSLGSVVEAASALQGSSRSIQALKKALVHTPNPWVDSPKLIKEKLTTIRERLNDIVDDANKYGHKRQPASVAPPVPEGLKGKGRTKTADEQADEILAK